MQFVLGRHPASKDGPYRISLELYRPCPLIIVSGVVLFSTIRPLLVHLFATAQTTIDAVMMRMRSKLSGMMTIGVLLAVSGCMSPWSPGRSASSAVSVVQDPSSVSQTSHATTTDATESLEPSASNLPKTRNEATAAVLDELQQIGAIDHDAQQQLMADLREAKPEHWPLIVKQYHSALAYRQQLLNKESQHLAEQSASTAVKIGRAHV